MEKGPLNMAYVYMGQPYSDPDYAIREGRYNKAMAFVGKAMKSGVTIYSPIIHFHNLSKYHSLPTDAEFWEHHNYNMLSKSVALWVLELDGWEKSVGLSKEMGWAQELNLSIEHFQP
jgi:hypothetical protein